MAGGQVLMRRFPSPPSPLPPHSQSPIALFWPLRSSHRRNTPPACHPHSCEGSSRRLCCPEPLKMHKPPLLRKPFEPRHCRYRNRQHRCWRCRSSWSGSPVGMTVRKKPSSPAAVLQCPGLALRLPWRPRAPLRLPSFPPPLSVNCEPTIPATPPQTSKTLQNLPNATSRTLPRHNHRSPNTKRTKTKTIHTHTHRQKKKIQHINPTVTLLLLLHNQSLSLSPSQTSTKSFTPKSLKPF